MKPGDKGTWGRWGGGVATRKLDRARHKRGLPRGKCDTALNTGDTGISKQQQDYASKMRQRHSKNGRVHGPSPGLL